MVIFRSSVRFQLLHLDQFHQAAASSCRICSNPMIEKSMVGWIVVFLEAHLRCKTAVVPVTVHGIFMVAVIKAQSVDNGVFIL